MSDILESPKLLVVPPQLLSQCNNYNYVGNKIENYSIHKIQDGTTINMYWWDKCPDKVVQNTHQVDTEDSKFQQQNAWKISTAKAYDATNLSWNSDTTYKEAFESILSNTFDLEPDEFYSALDKKKCYSWGFNHTKYHPFWKGKIEPENKGNIWFIQWYNTYSMEI